MLSLPPRLAALGTVGVLAAALAHLGVRGMRRLDRPAREREETHVAQARIKAASRLSLATIATLLVAACSGSHSTAGASSSANVPQPSARSFTLDFSAMTRLRPLASRGSGSVAVILPDTVTSTRYAEFDAPMLTKAMQAAGLSGSGIIVQNAQGSTAAQYSQARVDIAKGARVLIVDPLDSGTGAKIESYAKSRGVPVIDYDRITPGGSSYYVGFNGIEAGTMLGKGLQSCITAWKVKNPQVIVMKGNPADSNAALFAHGYDTVIGRMFSGGQWKDVANLSGTSMPAAALAEFQAALTTNPTANAVLTPNDANAATIIRYLHRRNVQPMTFPVTGQDASLIGLQDIISGYQCGTIYEPIYREAQAAIALAMYLRAGITPPPALLNGAVRDMPAGAEVRSVLETPIWVTTANIESTVVRDNFVPASQICQGTFAADCSKYRIG